jgi:DNA polymerase-1
MLVRTFSAHHIKTMRAAAYDVETTGFDTYTGDYMFSFSIGKVIAGEIHTDVYRLDGADRQKNMRILQDFFLDTSIRKISHNHKFDKGFTKQLGIYIPDETVWEDTMLQSQLLRNLAPEHGLKELCWELGGISMEGAKRVRAFAKAHGGFHKVPEHVMTPYQHEDAKDVLLLFYLWEDKMYERPGLWEDYRNEIDLAHETQLLEEHGLMVDRRNCGKLLDWLGDELETIERKQLQIFGEIVNLKSGDQAARILYKKLGLPILAYTDKGRPSTEKDVLLALREKYPHPAIDLIIQHRSYIGGQAMVNSYLELSRKTGIIHPTINTNQARTGRESGERPNLQNVAKEEALKNLFPVPARKAFKCFPDHVLFLVDYSGIEMRLIIDRAGEEELIEVLQQHGDPHAIAAEMFYGRAAPKSMQWALADKAMRKTLRSAAKNGSFGKAYGAGLAKVCATLNMTIPQGKPGFDAYCSRFPKVANFTSRTSKRVKEFGFIDTPFGRRLHVERDKAYTGANYDIQGTAGGILKRAQVRVGPWLREHWPEVRLVLPIHDELIFSYPRKLLKHKQEILGGIARIMTTMPEIRVPLEVEWKITTTDWNSAQEFKLAA